jgi:hypothetical protein
VRLLTIVAMLSALLLPQVPGRKPVTGFICVPDYATGFAVGRSGKWEPTQFNVKGKRYLLRARDTRWYWTEFGEEPQERIDECTSFNDEGFSTCENRVEKVLFNRKTLRFQVVSAYGYVVADIAMDKGSFSMTPFYEIGTCSPL